MDLNGGDRETKAFDVLKQQLSNAPILGLPIFDKVFILKDDASVKRIRAVLIQDNRPISYFSCKLGPRMRMAATYQKELFDIMEAVYNWHQNLIGQRFIIRTNHESIKELMQQVVDDVLRMCEDEENVTALFMDMSQPMVGFIPDLKCKNESLKELLSLHQKMDRREIPLGFRLPVSKWLMSILVVVVHFSKYAHFGALPTSFNSHKDAEVFMEIVLKHHGFPKTIVSDRDPIFVCVVWEDALVGHSISTRIFKGSSSDELLVERDGLLRQLRQNLLTTKHRMEVKANPTRLSSMLAKRYYGLYAVVEHIEKVAYRLALPATSKDTSGVSGVNSLTLFRMGSDQTAYRAYNFEDELVSKGEGNVTPKTIDGVRTRRVSVAPAWHKDILI
ncbi:ty3-gypsy retrotransposon protein, partial [Tanacetum coccineum]